MTGTRPTSRWSVALVALAALVPPDDASARIYKCVDLDGRVSYSRSECTGRDLTDRVIADNGVAELDLREEREATDGDAREAPPERSDPGTGARAASPPPPAANDDPPSWRDFGDAGVPPLR